LFFPSFQAPKRKKKGLVQPVPPLLQVDFFGVVWTYCCCLVPFFLSLAKVRGRNREGGMEDQEGDSGVKLLEFYSYIRDEIIQLLSLIALLSISYIILSRFSQSPKRKDDGTDEEVREFNFP